MDDGSLEYRQEVYERMCAASREFSRTSEALLMLNATGTLLAAVDRRAAIRHIAVIGEQAGRAEYIRKMLEQEEVA